MSATAAISYSSIMHTWLPPYRRCASLVGLALLCAAIACPAAIAREDEGTADYFDGLRRLGLFSLAEGYCFEQLDRADLSPEQRVTFTIELSRTFAEHAKHTTGREQDDLWQRSLGVLDEFIRQNGDDPRAVEVQTQAALARGAQGEYLRWQAELYPHDAELARRADAALAEATSRLADAERSLDSRLTAARAARTQSPGPTALRLRTLLENVRHRQAATLIDRAKLKPRGDANRTAWLLDAEKRLRRLSGAPDPQELTWHSRVMLAECLRLTGELEKAAEVLDNLLSQNLSPAIRDAAIAQQARLALDRGRPDEADRLLAEHAGTAGRASGELHFLRVQALVASWEIARERGEARLADDLFEQIQRLVAQSEREVGGFWAHRSALLLEQARESARYGPALAGIIRRAQALYAENKLDAAIAEYLRAYEAARSSGHSDAAMELGYVRASIEVQAERFADAATHFRELADQFPAHERAASAHLLAAWAAGRVYERSQSDADRRVYERTLETHAERYASHPTRFDALWLLAGLRERAGQLDSACEIYRKIPAEHPRGLAAQSAIARCYEGIIDRLRGEGRDTVQWERSAEEVLGGYVERFPDPDRPLAIEQADVALRFARILLDRDRPDYEGAELLLRRIVTSWSAIEVAGRNGATAPADAAQWKALARAAAQWRIMALAGRGILPEAERLVAELAQSGTGEVLAVLDGLTRLTSRATDRTRRDLGEVQLEAALQLNRRRDALDDAERLRLDRCLAEAYVATNQPRKAGEAYQSLLARAPRDKELLRLAASIQLESGDAESLRNAKRNWATLESLEQPGSDDWMAARYHRALTLKLLGEIAEARKLAGVARLLYPDRGDAEIRRKLAELYAALGPG